MSFARRRKNIEMEERRALRDRREDAAGKLLQRVPELTSLSLAIHEVRPNGRVNETQYVRRVVLEHAAALFEASCSHADCVEGGYDMTREVLSALASRKVRFEGEQLCKGHCGAVDCGRVLHYVATATYRTEPRAEP